MCYSVHLLVCGTPWNNTERICTVFHMVFRGCSVQFFCNLEHRRTPRNTKKIMEHMCSSAPRQKSDHRYTFFFVCSGVPVENMATEHPVTPRNTFCAVLASEFGTLRTTWYTCVPFHQNLNRRFNCSKCSAVFQMCVRVKFCRNTPEQNQHWMLLSVPQCSKVSY